MKATGHLEQDPDVWPALIEQNAPGYLALEAEGKGDEYDHSQFTECTG